MTQQNAIFYMMKNVFLIEIQQFKLSLIYQFAKNSMNQEFLQNITDNYENQPSLQQLQKGERQYQNHSKQSHHSSMRKQQSAHSRQRYTLACQSKLDNLNHDLKYAGFNELPSFCFCELSNFDVICQLFNDILLKNKEVSKNSKDYCDRLFKQNHSLKRLQEQNDRFKQKEAQLIKYKEVLEDKYAKVNRENKQKIEKMMKEKEAFARQRKSWSQKQDVMKNFTRNLQERIRNLEQKLKKMQKLDKLQYKNVFEVNFPLNKPQRSLVQKQYEQTVVQTIQHHCKRLQEQNKQLKDQMKQFFSKIQKIVSKIDHGEFEQISYKQEIVDLPYNFSKSKGYPEVIKKILWIIQEKLNQTKIIPFKAMSNNNYPCDMNELTQSVNRLKGFYSVWQQINDKRNSIIPNIFNIFNEREKISKLAEMMDYQQFESADSQLRQDGNEIEGYIAQKIEQYNRELKRISSQKNQVQNLNIQLN